MGKSSGGSGVEDGSGGGGGGAPSGPAGGVLAGEYPNPTFAVDMATQAELDALVVSGGGDKTYVHNQGTPSPTWTINHTLAKFPAVTVVDSVGDRVEGDVHYTSSSVVVLSFSAAFSGTAYLN